MLDSSVAHQEQVPDHSSFTNQEPTSLLAQEPTSLISQEPFHEDTSTAADDNDFATTSLVTTTDGKATTPQEQKQHSSTFFSKLEHKFSDVEFLPNNGIPTDQFLKACEETLPFFSKCL